MKTSHQNCIILGLLLVVLAASGWGLYYKSYVLNKNLITDLIEEKVIVSDLTNKIANIEGEKNILNEGLEAERKRVGDLAEQVSDAVGTVGILDKLAKTDPQLLQKYSKVYFLNEHYIPSSLKTIDEEYVNDPSKEEQIHGSVWPHLEDMLEEAKEDGVELKVLSSYRSFGRQSELKASYKVIYGSGANTFSADQGYSEHQLGTTLDFTSTDALTTFNGFEKSKGYAWLLENAHKYGFVLSYPPNNQFYQFEPWHWRFVGEDLARDLHKDNMYFYDMDQRKINEYLVKIFD